MHMINLLSSAMFEVLLDGHPSSIEAVFPDWRDSDRFGIVIDEPFGGLGATQLIQMAATMFYDAKPSRRAERKVYRKRPAKSGVSSIRGQVVPSYAEAIRRSYRPAVSAVA